MLRQITAVQEICQQRHPSLPRLVSFSKLKDTRCSFVYNFLLNIADGVLITGSGNSAGNTSELYLASSGVSCAVTQLPGGRYLHRFGYYIYKY